MGLIYTPSYKQPVKEQSAPLPARSVAPTSTSKGKSPLERFESVVKGVGIDTWVGVAKSAADTALGFGELGQKIFNPYSWAGSEEAKKSQEFAKGLRESKYVAPQTTGESVGFVGGKIAQALAPGAAGLTATRAAASLPLASTAARTAAGFAMEAAPQLLLASGQEGGMTKNALISGLLSGVGGVGGKLPNAVIGLGQVGYGAKQLAEGDISGGAMNIGFGALGLKGAAKTKGLLVNKQVVPPSQQRAIKEATETIDTILGAQPKEAKIAQRKALAGQTAKTPGQIAVDHKVGGLTTDANGRLDTTKAREDIQTKINLWDDLLDNSLDDEYQRNSLIKERDAIVQTIKSGKVSGIKSASDKKSAVADIDQFFKDEMEDAGELVTDKKLHLIKRGLNSAYKGGEPRLGYEAQRAARSHIQKTIEDQVKDVNVNGINKMMGELMDLDRSFKAKQGMAVQGGRLTKKLNGIVGSVVGAPFGPFGSLAGAQLGEAISDYAIDPYRRSIAAMNNLDLSGFVQPGQKLRNETGQALADRTRANLTGQGKPKMLPAPSAIYAPAQTSKGPQMMSQRDAADSLRSTGTLPSEEEIRASMSGSPLKRMELLQRVQSHKDEALGLGLGLEFEPSEDGSIEFKGFDPTKAAMGFAGMTVAKKVKGKIPKVDLATQKEMIDVIDYARLKPGFNQNLEENASVLAEKFGVKGKTIADIANKFDDLIQKIKGKKGYPSALKEAGNSVEDQRLINVAKKFKTPEEFVESQFNAKPSYAMGHRPSRTGATAADITASPDGMGFPSDFYQHPEFYENMKDKSVKESFDILKKIKDDPDAEITIYRAGPKDEFNPGDWISLSKEYARGESLQEGTKVYARKVKAKDVQFAGDSINEFGYYPESQLTEIWNKANKSK